MSNQRPGFCGRTRREFLWEAGGGFTGLALAGLLDDPFLASQSMAADGVSGWTNPLKARDPHFEPKATNVIFLYMYGGPSHVDMFDLNASCIDVKTCEQRRWNPDDESF